VLLGRWVLVVPVKDARRGKTRLADVLEPGARAALVRAMALDTVEAVLAAPRVARVVVVTADPEVAAGAVRLGRTRVLPEPPAAADDVPGGWASLDRAVSAGVAAARSEAPTAHVAVLLGDLPGLDPAELDAALAAAETHRLAVVPDAEGSGTTLLTARAGEQLRPAFGGGSAAAHGALGHVVVELPAGSTLRHDVDVPADLAALVERGVGGRTGALLRRLGPLG
jgi:2-phospho-L-lactate guanylyltransferase